MRRDDRIAISVDRNDTPVNRYIPVLSFSRYGCFNRRYPISAPINNMIGIQSKVSLDSYYTQFGRM